MKKFYFGCKDSLGAFFSINKFMHKMILADFRLSDLVPLLDGNYKVVYGYSTLPVKRLLNALQSDTMIENNKEKVLVNILQILTSYYILADLYYQI